MNFKSNLFLRILISSLFFACGQKREEPIIVESTISQKKVFFEPNWKSIKDNYKTPDWFNKQKFGIFVHWGAYTVPAFGSEWYPRLMYMDTATFNARLEPIKIGANEIYTHHKEHWGNQKEFGYKDFIPQFKGEKFNASEWINLFKAAGAKYVIPVADHHDGFAMYKSNTTRWNAYDMGPKRDVLGELFMEGRSKGLIMGASTHYAFNWSFYNKKDHFDTSNPEFSDLYSSKGKNLYQPVSNEFKQRWWNRTIDLIDNYQPDILYFDFYLDIPDYDDIRPKIAAYYYNKGVEWNKEVVINDKNFNHEAFPEGTVIYDLERGSFSGIRKLPWQTDTSIGKNSWCYVSNWQSKTTNQLIDNLVDVVSKNGNLLLNVAPKSDGTIPEDQKAILLQMGDWLKVNGEAIFNTECWKTFGEGPTQIKQGHHSEGKNKTFTNKDIRFTKSKEKLFAMIMAWPSDNKVLIKSIKKTDFNVSHVRILGSNKNLKWTQNEHGLFVQMPKIKPCKFAYAIEIR